MAIAVWQDELCTGNIQVDKEHEQLFELVNVLHDTMMQGASHAIILNLLDRLAAHTIAHFRTEESLMVAMAYPGYERHKQTHDNLTAKVSDILAKLHRPEAIADTELTQFLAEWLSHHIKGEDRKMVLFLRQAVPARLPCISV